MEKKRKELFCELIKQGSAGAKLKADYEKIIKQLNLPRQVVEEMKISKDIFQSSGGQGTLMQTKQYMSISEEEDKHELVELF